jgi:acyl carrier protein
MQTLEQELRHFVVENFLFGQGNSRLSNDDSLLEQGIIDSTGVLELVSFLEQKYSIKVQDSDLHPNNLDSISKLCVFVEAKLRDGSAGAGLAG